MSAASLPILDFIASAQARDEALQHVTDNNVEWMRLALIQIQQFARRHDGWANTEYGVTGEDLRVMLIGHIGHPTLPKAWGALINAAVRKRLLFATGGYRPMKDKRSHGRKTPIYTFSRGP